MPAVLLEHTVARIDKDHRGVRRRAGCYHISRVLLAAGNIADEKFTLIRRKKSIRRVDRNALFPPRKSMHDSGSIDFVKQQPTHQCVLSALDAAAYNDAEETLVLMRLHL